MGSLTRTMRAITWLHISDFHLRESQAWAQDVVLSAMLKDIVRQRERVDKIDFVLATGDFVFLPIIERRMVRWRNGASDFESGGQGFESLPARQEIPANAALLNQAVI
jgi:hypothetical protein